ncbi:MAG TPA: hypothetical protein VID75_11555 [Acidimicrobiales bacterium]
MIVAFAAYALGALMGVAADRGGPRLRRDWPIYLRVQLVATAGILTVFSAWRLSKPSEIVAPVLIATVGWIILTTSYVTKRERSGGQAALECWAAFPNGGFWVLPMAAAFVGPAGSMVTALANAVYAAPNAACIHLMRRDAPIPQRRATSWIDQSALVGLGLGLALHLAGPAPAFSHWVLDASGPLFAFVGAALFTGSVLHPHNISVGNGADGIRRWMSLTLVRIVSLAPIVALDHSRPVQVAAVLSALGAPAFNPPQLAVLYGYRSAAVNASVRWGWVLLPIGYAAAFVLR